MNCIIIGAGNYSYVLLNYIKEQKEKVNIIGFLDDDVSLHGTLILDKPVLGDLSLLKSLNNSKNYISRNSNISGDFKGIKIGDQTIFLTSDVNEKFQNYFNPITSTPSVEEVKETLQSEAILNQQTSKN